MKVQEKVRRVWKGLSRCERLIMRTRSGHAPCAVLRCRCKVIVSLVQGKSPRTLACGGLCSGSQVYRVAQRFVEQGPAGMADQREDNGDHKINETYEWELLIAVACSPRDYGYLRTTWTQELLVRVLAKRTGITVSPTTVCRLLKRHRVRLGQPKPIVGCPWSKARRMRRLRQIRKLVRTRAATRSWCTSTKWIFTSIPRLGRTGCCAANRRRFSRQERTKNATWQGPWMLGRAGSLGWKPNARPATCSSSCCGNC